MPLKVDYGGLQPALRSFGHGYTAHTYGESRTTSLVPEMIVVGFSKSGELGFIRGCCSTASNETSPIRIHYEWVGRNKSWSGKLVIEFCIGWKDSSCPDRKRRCRTRGASAISRCIGPSAGAFREAGAHPWARCWLRRGRLGSRHIPLD